MINGSGCCLVVFAREPALNRVKQRLAAEVGARPALSIYQRLLERTLRLARSAQRYGLRTINGNQADIRLVVAAATSGERMDIQRLRSFCAHAGASLILQRGDDLGSRMHHAIQDAAHQETDRIVLVGSDCPDLQRTDLKSAFEALEQRDVCIVPTADGGYCLVGTRGDAPDVFEQIDWGQPVVAEQTRRRCRDMGLSIAMLSQKHDVDFLSDWSQWCARQRARSLPEHAWEHATGDAA